MGISFTSGWQDLENPPLETLDYDIEELPIGAESDLTLEEKLDIIFNLSGWEKQKYLVYIDNIANCKGDRDVLKRVAKNPNFTRTRNNFIYRNLNGTPDRFIKSIINRHYDILKDCEGLTYTDLIQEGWIALIKVAKRYMDNEKRNKNTAKFSTVAYYRVEGRVQDILREEIKTSMAESEYDQEKFETSIEKEAFTIHKMEQLDSREQKILKLYAGGYTLKNIGKRFSLTKGRISQIISAISKPD